MYQYKFDKNRCWYKKACSLFDSKDCTSACLRFMEMDYMFFTSGLPTNLQYPILLQPDKKDIKVFRELDSIKRGIQEFVQEGSGLFIGSANTGNGKTTWAAKLLCKYFDEVWPGNAFRPRGLWVNVQDLILSLKEDIKHNDNKFLQQFKNLARNIDLVVWDDIGGKKLSGYDYDILYSYINARIQNGKSNIFTSNFVGEELTDQLGNRLYSRVYTNSIVIEFVGHDFRGRAK